MNSACLNTARDLTSAPAPATETVVFHIAVLAGDGIGPEVCDAALHVLRQLQPALSGVRLEFREYSVGVAEYLQHGDPLPAAALRACAEADAVLLGAMGLPTVRWPDGREMTPQIDLREQLDLYCGLRPVRLLHPGDCPLKRVPAGGLDLLLVRENCEGLFSSRHQRAGADPDRVCDLMTITRRGTERVARAAFREARKRRHRVTLVDKANVLPSMAFFRRVFDEVAQEFPDVETDHVYVDAATLYLIRDPGRFDVLLTENLFGDILSDLMAALVGGMGLAPSADLGDRCGVFQPAHGSAPDIAGKGIANPTAMILSAAMMLEWLDHPQTLAAAGRLRRAVQAVYADPAERTPDLGGRLTTGELTARIIDALGTV